MEMGSHMSDLCAPPYWPHSPGDDQPPPSSSAFFILDLLYLNLISLKFVINIYFLYYFNFFLYILFLYNFYIFKLIFTYVQYIFLKKYFKLLLTGLPMEHFHWYIPES